MIKLTESIMVKHGLIISFDKSNHIFADGAIFIQEGKIAAVGKTRDVSKNYKAEKVIEARGKAVLPGLINAHMHSGGIRGIGDDLPLYDWLKNCIFPQHKASRLKDAYALARLSYCESIKSGTTCIIDMHPFTDRRADAVEEIGIRAVLVPDVSDQIEYMEKFEDTEKLINKRNGSCDDRIRVWCGFHNSRDSSPDLLDRTKEIADKYDTGIHTHTNETIRDIELARKSYGKRPIEHLHDHGITGSRVLLAHCVWLSDNEIKIIQKTGTNVAHCPMANMKLADGISPVPTLLDRGVEVGLGTDGGGSGSCSLDMFQVMKSAALLQKVNELDATVMSAEKVLRMATLGGAEVLGMGKELGSIEKGKKADIILVDLNKMHMTPILTKPFNVISRLVYAAIGSDVETVIVDGKVVMENRIIKNVDECEIIRKATEACVQRLQRMRK